MGVETCDGCGLLYDREDLFREGPYLVCFDCRYADEDDDDDWPEPWVNEPSYHYTPPDSRNPFEG